jgi:hypothetical protein
MERSNSCARIEVGRANAVPVVGKKHPSCHVKRVPRPRSVEGLRQPGEIRPGEFLSPPEQAHGDKEIGKKRTPEFRRRDRVRHGGDNRYGEDADRKIGAPRYLLFGPLMERSNSCARIEGARLPMAD